MKQELPTNSTTSKVKVVGLSDQVVVIGGGMGGAMTAWHLAENGIKIILIDAASELLSGSCGKTPGRMGLGFYYTHKKTALMYLRATLEFQNQNRGNRVNERKDINDPLRRGRYFITKDS